jgi:hypothetical protein
MREVIKKLAFCLKRHFSPVDRAVLVSHCFVFATDNNVVIVAVHFVKQNLIIGRDYLAVN